MKIRSMLAAPVIATTAVVANQKGPYMSGRSARTVSNFPDLSVFIGLSPSQIRCVTSAVETSNKAWSNCIHDPTDKRDIVGSVAAGWVAVIPPVGSGMDSSSICLRNRDRLEHQRYGFHLPMWAENQAPHPSMDVDDADPLFQTA